MEKMEKMETKMETKMDSIIDIEKKMKKYEIVDLSFAIRSTYDVDKQRADMFCSAPTDVCLFEKFLRYVDNGRWK